MKERRFELADQFQIADFEETASTFFEDILGMDYSQILLTDESALSDFTCCGESCSDFPHELNDEAVPRPEQYVRWDKWAREKVSKRYGVEVTETGTVYLVALFRQIEAAKEVRTQ
jgi:hypothetical protein